VDTLGFIDGWLEGLKETLGFFEGLALGFNEGRSEGC